MMHKTFLFLFSLLVLSLFVTACTEQEGSQNEQGEKPTLAKEGGITIPSNTKTTFKSTGDSLCSRNGKPIIRKFATTWCPHCQWVEETYTKVVEEYVAAGKIDAYLWQVDIGDDALTPERETTVPNNEIEIFKKYNPKESIPTFVFGCEYARVGNGYEAQNDLQAEEAEFRSLIEKLISQQNN